MPLFVDVAVRPVTNASPKAQTPNADANTSPPPRPSTLVLTLASSQSLPHLQYRSSDCCDTAAIPLCNTALYCNTGTCNTAQVAAAPLGTPLPRLFARPSFALLCTSRLIAVAVLLSSSSLLTYTYTYTNTYTYAYISANCVSQVEWCAG